MAEHNERAEHTNFAFERSNQARRPTESSRQNNSYRSSHSHRAQKACKGIHRPGHPIFSNSHAQSAPRNNSRPIYSLAGNSDFQNHGLGYVSPGYYALNPEYQKTNDQPLWGLAKPLPRVVRPGMRKKGHEEENVEDKHAEREQPGSAEAIPQVGMISDQREDTGLEANTPADTEEWGYGHQYERRRPPPERTENEGTQHTHQQCCPIDQYGTPKEEKGDPMDEWSAKQGFSHGSSNPFEDAHGDLGASGLRKLSSVREESTPDCTTTCSASSNERPDHNDIDLESGEQYGDWPVEDEQAEKYIQEDRDNYNGWATIRARLREPLAECLATTIAILIGLCTNLSVATSNDTAGTYLSRNWAWGLGITIGIYIAGGISGGHLNPAISLMLSLYRGFPLRKALVYIAAQLLGAFIAGLVAYGVYRDAILSYDNAGGDTGSTTPVSLATGGIGLAMYTQPSSFSGPASAFANEFVATAILSCAILALGDDSNAPPGAGMHAFIVGLLVTALTMAFGYNTGACLNPARDFGPRLATAAVGYGEDVFKSWDVWWIWGPWGATISGALLGGLLYDGAVFVGGESPINYPRGRRRRAKRRARDGVRQRWRIFTTRVRGQAGRKG